MKLIGIVLCGGASRRMGRDKVWLDIFGEPLLVRVVEVVRQISKPVIVVAGPEQIIPNLHPSVLIVRDAVPFAGPVAGVFTAAYQLVHDSKIADMAFATGVDAPLLTPELIEWMAERTFPGRGLAANIAEDIQPLPAIYPLRSLFDLIPDSAKITSLRSLVAALPFDIIAANNTPVPAAFHPANTPEEFSALLATAAPRTSRSIDPASRGSDA